ncbi:SURF1 family cytochrome oxidase biogenesis protein [Ornithinimicrobium faecis]|uniref:SURF1-like protein n=1 Tax=Ornithinimicrobium faecis TaxID=2934158 RepID=A0ABY4YNI7_9MICO|nr:MULTISPECIES: SURF1 family protein [unclassified Ornithinimicrobium]USQ78254.1 SURF1 family protein [Ornithinimicrobium sp. HY1793]
MLRTLLTGRWLGYLALGVVFAVVTVLLGNWQFSRHEDKVAARDRVEAHYDAVPVPLEDVLTADGAPLPEDDEWTRVIVSGEYAVDQQLYVRNRPQSKTYGYEILVPLDTAAGTLAVDRGWAPNAETAATLPDVPPAPEGEVEVTGWLRPGEADLERDMPPDQLASINLATAEQRWERPVLGAYLVLQEESYAEGSAAQIPRPTPLLAPRTDLGSHFAYSLQWWLSSPVLLILVFVMARREWLEGEGRASQTRPGAEREGAQKPPKPKKVRIWDEEDW